MSSAIETLSSDLFEPILSDLDVASISRLQCCSKALDASLGAYIFTRPSAIAKLMMWGCTRGEEWAIKKAVAFGADISVVELFVTSVKGSRFIRISTLSLAARRYRYDTFQFLIDCGARLDLPYILPLETKALRQRLFHPQGIKLLRLCLDNGLQNQIRQFQAGLDDALLLAVKASDGDACEALLHMGANPTAVVETKKYDPESPLALAILSGSTALVSLLLPYMKTDDQVPDLTPCLKINERAPCPWKVVPILAVARHMAIHGSAEMLEMLLKAGANINIKVRGHLLCFWRLNIREPWSPDIFYPLMVYLLSLDFSSDAQATALYPSAGVQLLLAAGARIVLPDRIRADYGWRPNVPLIRLVWKAWGGLKCLVYGEAYAMITLLIQLGACRGVVHDFVVPWEYLPMFPGIGIPARPLSRSYTRIMARWRCLLDAILTDDNFYGEFTVELDDLLFEFLTNIFSNALSALTQVPDPCPTWILYQLVDESHPVTISKLLEKGANINARSRRIVSYNKTILEYIFRHFSDWHREKTSHHVYINPLQIKRQRSFISVLVGLGAQPPAALIERSRSNGEGGDADLGYEKFLGAMEGHVVEEESLLWNPSSGFLIKRSSERQNLLSNSKEMTIVIGSSRGDRRQS